jgi:hypothetical protein
MQRPRVPHEVRGPFLVAGVAVTVAWSVGALFGALSGSVDAELLHNRSHALAGAVLFAFNICGGIGQVVFRRHRPRSVLAGGTAGVVVGIIMVAVRPASDRCRCSASAPSSPVWGRASYSWPQSA